jgi:hypothetical protein
MYIGDVSGCHEVPEPICPRFITFPLPAEPILIPIASPDITNSGSMAGSSPICISGILPEGFGDGLADGAGGWVCGAGDAEGVGDAAGIFMPGI